MPQSTKPTTDTRAMPMQMRAAQFVPSTYNAKDNTIEVVWTQGAAVRRYDYYSGKYYDEVLDVTTDAVDMTRFDAGTVQVLDGHRTYGGVQAILGIAQRGWIEGGEGKALLRLSQRPEVAGIVADIQAGVIRAISFGYSVQRYAITKADQRTDGGTVDLYQAVRWTPTEISFVPVPADPGAGTRSNPQGNDSAAGSNGLPCEFVMSRAAARNTTQQEQQPMPKPTDPTAAPEAGGDSQNRAQPGAVTPTPQQPPAQTTAPSFDGQRAADILALCQRHGLTDLSAQLLRNQSSMEDARKAVLDELDKRGQGAGAGPTTQIRTVNDEHDTRLRGIENALMHRANPTNQLDDNGRQYRGLSVLEMAREVVEGLGVSTRGLSRMDLARTALQVRSAGAHMGTGDFTALLGGMGQRVLRAAYDQAPSTYQIWARRASNLPDFRIRQIIGVGGDTELKRLNEHGEYTFGSLNEDGTGYKAMSYGRSLAITRQMMVNDDLSAFSRVATRFADSARRLENRLVYQQLLDNPKMGDGKALFHADHKNLKTEAGSALSLESLSDLRTLMRKQTGTDGESLNISPAYLLVPSDLETKAYQFTSPNYVPATPGAVNEFRTGGRTALEPVVEPLLDANSATAFYLLAASGQIDTVEYAYVDGYEGLRVETFTSEDVDGIKLRATLDFATKAVEHRGLAKSMGVA